MLTSLAQYVIDKIFLFFYLFFYISSQKGSRWKTWLVLRFANAFFTDVHRFLIPTIYFHLTTMYDILRMKGVPLGKLDYLTHFLGGVEFL